MDPMIENFNFLLRHNVIYTKMRLCKMRIVQNARCDVCEKEDKGFFTFVFIVFESSRFYGRN